VFVCHAVVYTEVISSQRVVNNNLLIKSLIY
jgi:hypothetical protein